MELILEPGLQKFVEQQAASGKYASVSEIATAVVQELMDKEAKAAAEQSAAVKLTSSQETRE